VIAGDVAVMVALVLVAILAALWRPGRLGAALLAGAIVPMAAQAISAIIQVAQSGNAFNFFGITPGQASAAGVRISSGVTTAFWLYGAFVLVMIVLCARMLTMPSAAVAAAGAAPSPLAARPLAFPGSGPHTFRADGPYAYTAGGSQTGEPSDAQEAGPSPADLTGELTGTASGGQPVTPHDELTGTASGGQPVAPHDELTGTASGEQPVTPPDGLPAQGNSSG
jgi:hypothetical protein